MVERTERVTQVSNDSAPAATEPVQTARTTEVTNAKLSGAPLLARIIQFITSVILVLLVLRLLLVLLGAHASNGFAHFIYSVSHPFVAPFFGLFGYNLRYGTSKFETYTVVAIIVYALVGYGLARLASIRQPRAV